MTILVSMMWVPAVLLDHHMRSVVANVWQHREHMAWIPVPTPQLQPDGLGV